MRKWLFALLFALTSLAYAAVDINTATQAELETLKTIGPVKAKAIIEYREKNGLFKSVDDLEKVKGIGPGILKKVRSGVTVSGGAPQPAAKQGAAKTGTGGAKAKNPVDARVGDKK